MASLSIKTLLLLGAVEKAQITLRAWKPEINFVYRFYTGGEIIYGHNQEEEDHLPTAETHINREVVILWGGFNFQVNK